MAETTSFGKSKPALHRSRQRQLSLFGRLIVAVALSVGFGVIANTGAQVSAATASNSVNPKKPSQKPANPPKVNPGECTSSSPLGQKALKNCRSNEPGASMLDSAPPGSAPPDPSPQPEPYQQDVYKDICVPMSWVNCAEYRIYDAEGNLVNRVVGNSDWSTQYIASISGGGAAGSAVWVRDFHPLDADGERGGPPQGTGGNRVPRPKP